jgi:hypothetical protein
VATLANARGADRKREGEDKGDDDVRHHASDLAQTTASRFSCAHAPARAEHRIELALELSDAREQFENFCRH